MSNKVNEMLLEELYMWATNVLGRPARNKDIIKKTDGFYVNEERIPNNLQETCSLLTKSKTISQD